MIGKFTLESFTTDAISLAVSTVPISVANAFVKLGQLRDLAVLYYTDNPVTIGEYSLDLYEISPEAVAFVTSDDGQSLDDDLVKLSIIAAYKVAYTG